MKTNTRSFRATALALAVLGTLAGVVQRRSHA